VRMGRYGDNPDEEEVRESRFLITAVGEDGEGQ
jgi:hypothetical protein